MTLTYKKLKDYILTTYDLSSLTDASHKCTAFYDKGEITKLEYQKTNEMYRQGSCKRLQM